VDMDWDLYLVASIGLRFTTSRILWARPGSTRTRHPQKRVRPEVSNIRNRYGMPRPVGPSDRNSGLSHAQAGCGIVQSGAASQVVPRLRFSGGSAGGRAETSTYCSIVATAYQETLGEFDGKKRDEFARAEPRRWYRHVKGMRVLRAR
jgi:hypothetical protein